MPEAESAVAPVVARVTKNFRSGTGTTMEVEPEYVTRRGSEAMVGRMSLARQGRSSTSSMKPRSTMKHTEVSAEL
jgi:hypothetical protein